MSVDVLPADVSAEYAPAMVRACSDALGEGSCAMASTLPESAQPEAVALILWQGSGLLQVTVRVGRGGGQWVARALTFSEKDSISERWTTVGLTVATLVGEAREPVPKRDPDQVPPVGQAPTQVARPAVAAGPTAPVFQLPPVQASRPNAVGVRSWRGDVGLVTGPGWRGGGWRSGGWLSLGYRVPGWPLLLHASGSYALSVGPRLATSDVMTRWATVGMGAGLAGTLKPLELGASAGLELAFRRVDADFRGHRLGDQDFPLRLRGQVSFPAGGTLGAVVGVAMRLLPISENKNHEMAVTEAALSAEVAAGLEVRL